MADQNERWRFPNGEVITVHPDYYPASCDKCGWQGSSQDTISSPTGGDDYDVLCPKCHHSGADCGDAGERAVRLDPDQ